MKALKQTLMIACVVGFFIFVGIIGKIETHYERSGIVKSAFNGIVVVEDLDGHTWEIDDPHTTVVVGENVCMEMHTVGTSEIEDDVVVEIRGNK